MGGMSDSLGSTSTEVLEHECTTLAAQIASATCRFLLVIAELDRREAWGRWDGCKTMAHWLSWRCSMSPTTAWEHVRVARRLRELPLITEAFARGELSYSKVRAISRVATPEGESALIELARTATAAQLETIVRATVAATRDPARSEELRVLHTGTTGEGMGELRAILRPEELEVVEAALEQALPDSSAEESPVAARRVTALVRMAESYLAHGDAARPGGDRHAVVVHAEIDRDGEITSAETESGRTLPPATAERLLCDATRLTIVHDGLVPLGSGRATRTPNRAMRRAIYRRSGGRCEFEGCSERVHVELHHVIPWSKGGPTEWWNLAALCWHHHHLVHERGFAVRVDPDTAVVTSHRPDGSQITVPRLSAPPDTALADLPEDVIVPLWSGERLDLELCVDAVLNAERHARRAS